MSAQGPATLVSGNAEGNFEQQVEGTTPDGVLGLFVDSKGRILLPGRKAVYQFIGQSEKEKKNEQFIKNLFGGMIKPDSKKAFVEIQASELPGWTASAVCSFDPSDNTFVILDQGLFSVWTSIRKGSTQPVFHESWKSMKRR